MITRRSLVRLVLGTAALGGCDDEPLERPAVEVRYGDDPSQVAELHLPSGDRQVPAVVVIHGGFWMSAYGKGLATPLAADLAKHGVAGYAIEYRRVGNGGGWPATCEDVAAAIDALGDQPRIDPAQVVALGHSAGGQLAVWAAGRPAFAAGTPGARPRVVLKGAVAQAGVLDLVKAYDERVGGDAVQRLMGSGPADSRVSYAAASPYEQVPLPVPVALVHGTDDRQVPIEQSRRYSDAVRRAGGQVRLTELPRVGHFELIDPEHDAWVACRDETLRLLG
ncbi:conserved hypothetical protein [Kribbella flavida DSM 17836]|uniref:BD-FAE-like domain-containing protein n=1 Tax=Kribbella flavida (strain DSM 17836 / JCM 10339 / NBRC 14399) TaxID=479435 RepID=D2Q3B6_KRIFD|nr:alpha/beta fold hydrolase [Kribbella flavida]ADB34039.1 conserved hypothetical protein [Kribbella flavida DSM 17836]